MTAADGSRCDRVRRADVSALDELLARHHPGAQVLARAAAVTESAADESLEQAWELLVAGIIGRTVTDGTRSVLLSHLMTTLAERRRLDPGPAAAAPRRAFYPPDDRWAGWWDDEQAPREWPPGTTLPWTRVARALREVPVGLRVLLILRDAIALAAQEAESVIPVPAARQPEVLDDARRSYVAALDEQLTGTGAAEGESRASAPGSALDPPARDGEADLRPALRARARIRDISCDAVFGLVGLWLDGSLAADERDAYEQHLLLCPWCVAYVGKTRLALAALRGVPASAPAGSFRRRLITLIQPEP